MKLLFNVIALLLATTVLAAPVPSRPSDALIDGSFTSEHTLAHHHHVHNSKHAKHVHHDEAEVETRSPFNDKLEERSFYEDYTRFERRAPGDKDKGKGKVTKIVSGIKSKLAMIIKHKSPSIGSPSNTRHSLDLETHVGSPTPAGHIANHITPFNLPSPPHSIPHSNSLSVPGVSQRPAHPGRPSGHQLVVANSDSAPAVPHRALNPAHIAAVISPQPARRRRPLHIANVAPSGNDSI